MVWLMIWLGLDHPIDSFLSSIPFGVCVCVGVCVCRACVALAGPSRSQETSKASGS